MLQNGYDPCHMGGKGTETLLNTLFIPDIRKHILKNRKLRTIQCRDMQSCLSHQHKQSNGLQRYRFSACIWSCNDQLVKVPAKINIDGDNLFRVKQGMSALPDMNGMLPVKHRSCGILLQCQCRLGKGKVKKRHDLLIFKDLFCMLCNLAA